MDSKKEGATPAPDISGCDSLASMGCDYPADEGSNWEARIGPGIITFSVWVCIWHAGERDTSLARLMRLGTCDIFMTPS